MLFYIAPHKYTEVVSGETTKPPEKVVFLFYKYVGGNSPKRGKDCNIFVI